MNPNNSFESTPPRNAIDSGVGCRMEESECPWDFQSCRKDQSALFFATCQQRPGARMGADCGSWNFKLPMIIGYPLRADNVKDAEECGRVTLLEAEPDSLADFKIALQDSFRVAAEADLGHPLEEPIPSNEDVEN